MIGGSVMKQGFFGSLFDFNRDGKLDLGEQYLDYKLFEECTRQRERSDKNQSGNGFLSWDSDNDRMNKW